MAFIRITDTFSTGTGAPATGTLDVYLRGTLTHTTLYSDTTGVTTITNPCAITNGLVTACVAEGSYDLVPTIGGVTGTPFPFEAISGDRVKPSSPIWQTQQTVASAITPHSSNFTAVPGEIAVCTGGIICGLPLTPTNNDEVMVVSQSGTVIIARGGSDTINEYGLTGLLQIKVGAGMTVTLKYFGGVWYIMQDSRPIGWRTAVKARTPGFAGTLNSAWNQFTNLNTSSPGYDNGYGDGLVSNTVTARVAGVYHIEGIVDISVAVGVGNGFGVAIYKNGTIFTDEEFVKFNGDNGYQADIGGHTHAAAGDAYTLYYWVDAGLAPGNISGTLEVARIA